LIALAEFGAIFDHLREAETLATSLNDQRRLGWVSAYMSNACIGTSDQDRAVELDQRALTIATASGDFALEMMATFTLGLYYNLLGNYRQAVHHPGEKAE